MTPSQSLLAALGALTLALSALPAGAATSPARAQYEKQKAECLSGQSNQDKATCMKEAGAALAEAQRGQLDDSGANFRQNQMDRCKALSGTDRSDCIARMKGAGTVSGSVSGGGILRERKTSTPPGGTTVLPQAAPPLPPPVTASGPN